MQSSAGRASVTRGRRVSAFDLNVLLGRIEAAPPVAAADVISTALLEAVAAHAVSFLIADYGGQALNRLSYVGAADAQSGDAGREKADVVPLEATPHGRAIAEQTVQVVPSGHAWQLIAPVTSRGEAVGVLELLIDEEPDARTVRTVATAGHALAYFVIASRRFTDLFEWGQRSVPLSLEAEIQHRLLPASYTCEGGQFTLAGWLEPAGDVGGDTFDFSLDRDTLHLSMTDAMGHTLEAALLATVLVGALRNARRRGVSLDDQVAAANAALAHYATDGAFVTGQVARLDLVSGVLRIVNAGHPPPLLIRHDAVAPVAFEADPPFGPAADTPFHVQQLALHEGDRLVFLTDGMLERDAAGIDIAAMLLSARALHPREAVQAMTRAVVAATGGRLEDDATIMCLDWHGGSTVARTARAGADH